MTMYTSVHVALWQALEDRVREFSRCTLNEHEQHTTGCRWKHLSDAECVLRTFRNRPIHGKSANPS